MRWVVRVLHPVLVVQGKGKWHSSAGCNLKSYCVHNNVTHEGKSAASTTEWQLMAFWAPQNMLGRVSKTGRPRLGTAREDGC